MAYSSWESGYSHPLYAVVGLVVLPYFVGIPIGAACGTSIAGKVFKQEGSFWKSWGGGTVGLVVGTGVDYCVNRMGGELFSHNEPGWMNIGLAYSCLIVGAVIGYNWGK
ncbi:MAG: hypothetical protein HY769_03145 [Candidatus Stahlbacteria bacterium]|nr:hypothetical protein [Candidatus Stahlbacteria bacterium]